MVKVESSVKPIPYPQEIVYQNLSDLSRMERIKNQLPPDKVQDLSIDRDSISFTVPMAGTIRLKIVNREPPKTIKMETEKSPVPLDFWIQLLPTGENSCKMKLTVKADVTPFLKGMVQKPLQEGIEKMAEVLARLPYGE